MIRLQVLLSGFGYYVYTETLKDLFQRILRVIAEKACDTQVYTCVAGNQRSSGTALPQKSGRDLTPKVLANFSPGFPTLGKSASLELLTLKEFHPVL